MTPVSSLAGRLSLGALAGLLSQADIALGNDGRSNLARMSGLATVNASGL